MNDVSKEKRMKIYVASSWRNLYQPEVVLALRAAGHDVYDFRHPPDGDEGFHWSQVAQPGTDWKTWTVRQYADALDHPSAKKGFQSDMAGLEGADLCVLLMPSGRSASWEYGYHCGMTGRCGVVMIPRGEPVDPELMYSGADIVDTLDGLLHSVAFYKKRHEAVLGSPRGTG